MRRRWWGTLRLRVTAAAVLLLTAALVVSVVALAGFLRGTLRNSVEHHLDNQINEVVALARRGELPAALAPTGRESGQIQVIAADGRVVARSSGAASAARFDVLARPAPGARVAATVDGVKIDGDRGERYLVVARAAETPSGPVVVYGVSTLRGADRAVRALKVASVIGIPTLVLLAGLFAWRAVRRALAPVEAMSAEVDEIEANALDRRLAAPAGDDEIARLARTLNHMLDRLQDAFERQSDFVADASHELRTPLTALRGNVHSPPSARPSKSAWPTPTGRTGSPPPATSSTRSAGSNAWPASSSTSPASTPARPAARRRRSPPRPAGSASTSPTSLAARRPAPNGGTGRWRRP